MEVGQYSNGVLQKQGSGQRPGGVGEQNEAQRSRTSERA